MSQTQTHAEWNKGEWKKLGDKITSLWDDFTGKSISDDNIAFQQKENDLTRLREDTAYQRKVDDLKKAGLNPALALGGGANAVSMSAPQRTDPPKSAIMMGALNMMNAKEAIMTQRLSRKVQKHDLSILQKEGRTSFDQRGMLEKNVKGVLSILKEGLGPWHKILESIDQRLKREGGFFTPPWKRKK